MRTLLIASAVLLAGTASAQSTLPTVRNSANQPVQAVGTLPVDLSGNYTGPPASGSSSASARPTLTGCVASTAAPTYLTATVDPFSCDLKGQQRVLIGDITGAAIDWSLPVPTYPRIPTDATAGTAITTVQNVSNTVILASAGNLLSVGATTTATAGLLMVFNSTTVPADGAVTPVICIPVAASTAVVREFMRPARFTVGISVALSSGVDCQAKVAITAENLTAQYAQ